MLAKKNGLKILGFSLDLVSVVYCGGFRVINYGQALRFCQSFSVKLAVCPPLNEGVVAFDSPFFLAA